MSITINVTQEDIDKAIEAREHDFWDVLAECPIARASSRALNKECWSNYTCVHTPEHMTIMFFHPLEVIMWIEAFDHHGPVQPFSFEVELEPQIDN